VSSREAARRPVQPSKYVRPTPEHHKPQIKGKATLRKGRRGWYLTYNFPPAFRLFEMGLVVPIPHEFTDGRVIDPALEGTEVEIVVRQYVNAARCDEPLASEESREEVSGDGADEENSVTEDSG